MAGLVVSIVYNPMSVQKLFGLKHMFGVKLEGSILCVKRPQGANELRPFGSKYLRQSMVF